MLPLETPTAATFARRAVAFVCVAVVVTGVSAAAADEVSVPVGLQIALLDRILRYERRFASEATPVHVLVVGRAGSPESVSVASQVVASLRRAGRLGGRAVSVTSVSNTSPRALRAQSDATHARVIYLAPGLGRDVVPIVAALAGGGAITVAAIGTDADRGAVLGFELVSSRPRIVVNLAAARGQHLQFNGHFLRLARVVQ